MIIIKLQQLQFFAHHGLYEAEKIHGNNFEVDIDIEVDADDKITSIKQTVDYSKVYEIVRARMAVPTPLLETLAQEMVELIYLFDRRIKSVSLTIKKLTPPIEDFKGSVGVHFKKIL